MQFTSLSSREFNQELGRAKKSSKKGPVFITDRGRTTHVLLDIDDYRRITGTHATMADLLSNPAAAEIEFEPLRIDLSRLEVDFE